jgi:fumarate hydratase class II
MTERTSKKPRFTRVVKDGQPWLRDREGFKMVGPFNSFAECLVHELKAVASLKAQLKKLRS